MVLIIDSRFKVPAAMSTAHSYMEIQLCSYTEKDDAFFSEPGLEISPDNFLSSLLLLVNFTLPQ